MNQIDAFTTPGMLLRSAREARGLTAREAADRLHMMPDYVGILESDDYGSLRSPAFARGYLKAYCRLLELKEDEVLALYDRTAPQPPDASAVRGGNRPPQLQRTGLGVVTGLAVLLLLVFILWWRGGDDESLPRPAVETRAFPDDVHVLGGESR